MNKFFGAFLLFITTTLQAQVCPTLKDSRGNENDITIDCDYLSSNLCFDLTATFPTINNSSSYKVNTMPYRAVAPSATAKPVGAYRNNAYVKKLNFDDAALFGASPFIFHLYGKTYNSLVISSNGFITFNPEIKEGDFSAADFDGHNISGGFMPNMSVLGVYEDLDFSQRNGSEIYYELEGTAPCRTLTVTFYKGRINNTSQYVTSQIVLHEATGIVDVFVENRPVAAPSAKYKDAVIGVTDQNGKGVAAPGRDVGNWSAANEGWQFAPAGAVTPPKFTWYLDDKVIPGATGNVLQACPVNKAQVYKVNAIYDLKTDQFSIAKQMNVKYADTYPLTKDYAEFFCNGEQSQVFQSDFYSKISLNPVANFKFKFYTTEALARAGGAPIDAQLPLVKNQTYFVRLENKDDPFCYRIAKVSFQDMRNTTFTQTVSICDTNNDGIEKGVLLDSLSCQIMVNGAPYQNIKYFLEGGTTPVTSADITNGTKLYIEIQSSCGPMRLGPITVAFDPAPRVNTFTTPIPFSSCDFVNNDTSSQEEPFDWTKYFLDNNLKVSNDTNATFPIFYHNYEDAYFQRNVMKTIREGEVDKDYTYDVYARVDFVSTDKCKGNCFSIVKIPVRAVFTKIILNVNDADKDTTEDKITSFDEETADIYFCKDDTRNVDLHSDARKIITVTNPIGGAGLTVTYHDSWPSAKDLSNNGIAVNQMIPTGVNVKEYYVRYRLGSGANACYVVKPLVYHFVLFAPKQEFEICVNDLAQTGKIVLQDYTSLILDEQAKENPKPTLTFFRDAQATQMITEAPLGRNPVTVYAKITSGFNFSCLEVFPITFTPYERPLLKKDVVTIDIDCDNNYDGVEYYDVTLAQPLIVDNTKGDYEIEYFLEYKDGVYAQPIDASAITNYRVTDGLTFYLKVSRTGTGCFSNAKIIFNVKFRNKPVILNDRATLLKCNVTGQYAYYDLNQGTQKLYSDQNPPFAEFIDNVKYYETMADAEAERKPFTSTKYTLNNTIPRKIIYARFTSKQGCYSIKPLILRIIEDMSFRNTYTVPMCNDSFDGNYSFDLKTWLKDQLAVTGIDTSLLTDFDATYGAVYRFYRTPDATTPLTDAELENFHPAPGTAPSVWVVADGDGCWAKMEIKFNFGDLNVPEYDYPDYCGNTTVDLTMFRNLASRDITYTYEYYRSKADMIASKNPITNPEAYTYENIADIYVRITSSAGGCATQAIIHLPKPQQVPTLEHNAINGGKPYDFCPGSTVNVAPDFKALFPNLTIIEYEWLDAAGKSLGTSSTLPAVGKAGKYSVRLRSSEGCEGLSTFDVVERDVPVITLITGSNSDLTVTAKGSRAMVYAASYTQNGTTVMTDWQTSTEFRNLPVGVIMFYVKYADEQDKACIVADDSLIPDIHNAFTPNGDGVNDHWELNDLAVFNGQKALVKIIDRYGKVMFEGESAQRIIWDGKAFDKREIPTTSYWYVIQLPDGRSYNGWIMLKNRN